MSGHVSEPKGEGSCNSISTFKTLNCETEDVTLEHECDACPVHSVVANSRKDGHSIQAHRTYVWDNVDSQVLQCELERISTSRPGLLYNTSGSITHLRDAAYQMDFVIGKFENTCLTAQSGLRMRKIEGDHGLYVRLTIPRSRREVRSPPTAKLTSNVGNTTQHLDFLISHHMQYLHDIQTEHENRLLDAVNNLESKISKTKFNDLIVLSKISGVLAARSVGLLKCRSLESFGNTAVIRQCETVNTEFQVDNSSRCGPQPRFQNWTVGTDGWTLVPYSECRWKTTIVNFHGLPYQSTNNEWIRMRETTTLHRKLLTGHFKEVTFVSTKQFRTAIDREHPASFNLLSELAGTMEEHGVENIETLITHVQQAGQVPEIFS